VIIECTTGKFRTDMRDRASRLTLKAQDEHDGLIIAFLAECVREGKYKDMERRFQRHVKRVEKREAEKAQRKGK